MIEQYSALNKKKRIDLYLPHRKLAVEIEEFGHMTMKKEKIDKEREDKIKNELDCEFY